MSNVPTGLKPYTFHGLDLSFRKGDKEATGDCPFCGKEGKFSVEIKSSKWRCFVCGETGNQYTFLRKLWEDSSRDAVPIKHLASERKIKFDTLFKWGVRLSFLTDECLVPGYDVKGKLVQLYRYSEGKLLATPTIHHAIHGIDLYDPKKKVVYLCEGPWDAMKLWETLNTTKEVKGKFLRTESDKNLLAGANVLAVPGCSTFRSSWTEVFRRKRVYIVYDNDHPKRHPTTNKLLEPAGYGGVRRVSSILNRKPSSVSYLRWGKEGYDPKLPSGTDVRDILNDGKGFKFIHSRLTKVPKEWLNSEKVEKLKQAKVVPTDCTSWVKLSNQWRKALKWGDGLDITLSVMLASIVSTDVVGDQLWVKVIGPASCGKSTLCEAVSVSRKYVLAKSTIRGFHSGFKTDSEGVEDNSLIVQVAGKTLVTKDGDTLLSSPNLGQILSEARDIYDRTSRTHYRNKMSKEYTGVNMTWLLCGTSSLRSIDSSELGERFLDCVIMDGIDDDLEDEVLIRVAKREDQNISSLNGQVEEGHDKEMTVAMRMTGGYVEYLRTNAQKLLAEVTTPKDNLTRITRIGKFVAYMRARPSLRQQENAEREFGTRLVSQLLRLAKCLAVVMNHKEVDDQVMERVLKVALDTSRGMVLDMCNSMRFADGAETRGLTLTINQTEDTTRKLLRFLKAIGVVEQFQKKVKGLRPKPKWRLTSRMSQLMDEVLG